MMNDSLIVRVSYFWFRFFARFFTFFINLVSNSCCGEPLKYRPRITVYCTRRKGHLGKHKAMDKIRW